MGTYPFRYPHQSVRGSRVVEIFVAPMPVKQSNWYTRSFPDQSHALLCRGFGTAVPFILSVLKTSLTKLDSHTTCSTMLQCVVLDSGYPHQSVCGSRVVEIFVAPMPVKQSNWYTRSFPDQSHALLCRGFGTAVPFILSVLKTSLTKLDSHTTCSTMLQCVVLDSGYPHQSVRGSRVVEIFVAPMPVKQSNWYTRSFPDPFLIKQLWYTALHKIEQRLKFREQVGGQ